ncbi:MAG: DNA polymerase III subunit beta [Myxococcales bacterium]|nr:DNA polymerase III subunit beta [Myxococcales bacterium]MCB9707448.1 DNA polymerase III subunit beta [Myxococcales bacterium]
MEFTISKQNLLRGLTRTHAVADRKSSMPILSNVLLQVSSPGTLELSSTDLYLGVLAQTEATVKKGGSVAVSSRTLFEIVKNLPDADVHWQLVDKHLSHIQCGKVKYKIPGLGGESFPQLPSAGKSKFVRIASDQILELIALTHYAMSHDETRPHLAGALFEGDGNIARMVATDGHRLSKAEARLGQDQVPPLAFSMLVPTKGVMELKRLIEDSGPGRTKQEGNAEHQQVGIATMGNNAFFQRDGVQLSVKLAEEQFPPYAKVIPQSQQREIIALRTSLIEALKRISLVASDKSGGVRLQINPGTLQITSENPDIGEGSEELAIDFAGEPVVVGFNARYMLDVLGALKSDEVKLSLGGELDPGVLRPVGDTDFVGVIMPMRI